MENKGKQGYLTSNKTGFKPKTVTRDKEGYYIMIQGSNNQKNTTLINIYAANTEALKYLKQILTDMEIQH